MEQRTAEPAMLLHRPPASLVLAGPGIPAKGLGKVTDLEAPPRLGKRERFVEAACGRFHRHGVKSTTLADTANAANVLLGDVYYYFKAKDDITQAVVDVHADELNSMPQSLDRPRGPRARLLAFTRGVTETRQVVASHGCLRSPLCSKLGKRDDGLAESGAALMSADRLDREQFRRIGPLSMRY